MPRPCCAGDVVKIGYRYALASLLFLVGSMMSVSAIGWTRDIKQGGEGTTVVDANGVVIGRLLNDLMLVRKTNGGFIKLVFDEYGFVPSTRQLVFVYETSDCAGTAYLQQFGVPPIGMSIPDTWQSPPYRGAAEIYYPGRASLRTVGSYSRPLADPPAGCVTLYKPAKALVGTVEKQDLHFTPPFTLK